MQTLTRFPRLKHFSSSSGTVREKSFHFSAFDNFENIITKWGLLLSHFSGDQSPSFLVCDSSGTRVALSDGQDAIVYTDYAGEDTFESTALVFGKLNDINFSGLRISITFGLEENMTILYDSSIPSDFLPDLVSQINSTPSKLSILNENWSTIAGPQYLHEFLDYSSDSIALEFLHLDYSVTSLSYRQLGQLSLCLSDRLSKSKSRIVPIIMPKSVDMYVAVLGVLRAGKAFCPISEDAPEDRIRLIIEDIEADIALVSRETSHSISQIPIQCIKVEFSELFDMPNKALSPVSGFEVAYCMFTSGSTGTPKGVLVTHTNATQAILAHTFLPSFSRFLNFASLTFDVSVLEMFLPWLRGHTLVSADKHLLMDDLAGIINHMNVDACELTPSVAGLLRFRDVPQLKLLMTIGEKLTKSVIQEFGSTGILYNTYGPTEAAIQCTATMEAIESNFDVNDIGIPFQTTCVIVADRDNTNSILPLPVGWLGELVICGGQVARGYLNKAGLTKSLFLEDGNRFGKCYRSGDLARVLPSGRISFVGRVTEGQVKLRGQRLELAEIEHACRFPSLALTIRQKLVLVVAGDIEQARFNCERSLSRNILPDIYLSIDRIPLVASGKTDRKSIIKFAEESIFHEESFAYLNSNEEYLSRVISAKLDIKIGPKTSFRSVGLDSLSLMEIVAETRSSSSIILTVADMLVSDNVRDVLHSTTNSSYNLDSGSIANLISTHAHAFPQSVEAVLLATSFQTGVILEWFRDHRLYSNKINLLIKEVGSRQVITRAFKALIDRHEILRTGFAQCNGIIVQGIYNNSNWFSITSYQNEIPFEEITTPPFKVCLKRLSSDTWRADVFIHHAIYDGWSFDLALKELDSIIRLVPLRRPFQFKEASQFCHNFADSWWTRYLADAITAPLPRLLEPDVIQSTLMIEKVSLNFHEIFELATAASELEISVQSIFQLAWANVIRDLSNSSQDTNEIVFNTVVSRRTTLVGTGYEEALGPLISLLPIRVDLKKPEIECLQALTKIQAELIRHANVDFQYLLDILKGQMIPTLFVWQDSGVQQPYHFQICNESDNTEFDLILEVVPKTKYSLNLTYQTSKISKSHAQLVLELFEAYINQVIFKMKRRSLDVRPKIDMSLLSVYNPDPVSCNIDEVSILSKIDFDSDSIAVEFINPDFSCSTMTYRELYQLVLLYVQFLRNNGVLQQDVICVCMPKSFELYATILAIWYAGAIYVPIDINIPRERQQKIIEQSRATLCLVLDSLTVHVEQAITLPSWKNFTYNDSPLDLTLPAASEIAYIIFTSGSTGIPKGVIISHDNLANNILQLSELYPKPSRPAKMLQFCSISFDVSIFEIIFSLVHKMTIVSALHSTLLPNLSKLISATNITHLSLTPSVSTLLEASDMLKVEFVVLAGESITKSQIKFWSKLPAVLTNSYGPTEMTNVCSSAISLKHDSDPQNIGYALPNTSCFVLAPDSTTIVPKGATGELVYGGYQVARQYLSEQELTSNKFCELEGFGRVYRTGDLCRMLSDGSIVYLGRLDDQVKIRGQRVELNEINSCILKIPSVSDSLSLIIDEKLVTFVQSTQDEKLVKRLILSELENSLPSYMIPVKFYILERFPLTINGKINRAELIQGLAGTIVSSESDIGYINLAVTDAEKLISEILAGLFSDLDEREISIDRSLYYYGMDSLTVIRFVSRLNHLGSRISIEDITRRTTIKEIANLIDHSSGSGELGMERGLLIEEIRANLILEGYDISNISSVLPCTSMQEALLVSQHDYLNSFLFQLNSSVKVETVIGAWYELERQREILRTCFLSSTFDDISYFQIILKEHGCNLREVRLSSIDEYRYGAVDFRNHTLPPYCVTFIHSDTANYFAIELHHALFDGYALNLLLEDLSSLIMLTDIPLRPSYESTILDILNRDTTHGVKFYSKLLYGYEPIRFPILFVSPGSPDPRSRVHTTLTSTHSFSDFQSASIALGVSLLSAINSAWGCTLALLTGSRDVVFGAVSSGRGIRRTTEEAIAPTFYTYPVRCTLQTFELNNELLESVDKQNRDAASYAYTPIRKIVKSYAEENQCDIPEYLFDSIVILQNIDGESENTSWNNGLWNSMDERDDSDLAVILEVRKSRDGFVKYFFSYDNRFMDTTTAIQVQKLFDEVLFTMLFSPRSRLLELTQLEMPVALSGPKSGTKLLHSGFEYHAKSNGSKVAIKFLNDEGFMQSYTYSELDTLSSRFADFLKSSCQVEIEDSIPLCMFKSVNYYASVLASLKVGAAFCPIDPSAPAARIKFMLVELEAKVVIVDSKSVDLMNQALSSLERPMTVINLSDLDLSHYNCTLELESNLRPNNTAYRIYTSGSTGKPKAVAVEVRNAVEAIQASSQLLPVNSETRILQFSATTFDMSIFDIFTAFENGSTLCMASQQSMISDLESIINKLEVTFLDLTPTVASSIRRENLPTVKSLYCIGEELLPSIVNEWNGDCFNSYGPTEAAMCCTILKASPFLKSSNIGEPFGATTFHVLDPDSRVQLPFLSVGELAIGGTQLAREYFKNEDLTISKFFRLGGPNGPRVYRTGDLVRKNLDGTFDFMGRKDDQIKLRGMRIELGEINAVIREFVFDCTEIGDVFSMIVCFGESSRMQIVSFIEIRVCETELKILVDEVIDSKMSEILHFCQENLPYYMIPSIIIPVSKFPVSTAGKMAKQELKNLFNEFTALRNETLLANEVQELTDLQRTIRSIFSQVSGLEESLISVDASLYHLGMDSISASQIASRLRKLQYACTAMDILKNPSVSRLSQNIKLELKPIDKIDFCQQFDTLHLYMRVGKVIHTYPCTPTQEAILSQFRSSAGRLYFNHIVYCLPDYVDEWELEASWTRVHRRYDILRTGFIELEPGSESLYAQTILETDSVNWTSVDCTEADLNIYCSRTVKELSQIAYNNLNQPQIFLQLISHNKQKFLLIAANHAIYDATSLNSILLDVQHSQSTLISGYSSVINDILGQCKKSSGDDGVKFWKTRLCNSAITRFPNLNPFVIKSNPYTVHKVLVQAHSSIQNQASKLCISVQSAGLAAWLKLLSIYTGEQDIVTGLVLSGRTNLDTLDLGAFPCLTTLPFRAVLQGTNKELADSVHVLATSMLEFQHTPYSVIREASGSSQSLFDTLFAFQKTSTVGSSNEWTPIIDHATTEFAVSIELIPKLNGDLILSFTTNETLIPRDHTNLILNQYEFMLNDLLYNTDSLCINTEFPRQLSSVKPAFMDEISSDVRLLHEFVENQARISPNHIALEFATEIENDSVKLTSWSYAELDLEANRIANYLRNNFLCQGNSIVATCFEKSAEASFALIGILKAGCSFLALDPTAPSDRNAFICMDSQAICLLTHDLLLPKLTGLKMVTVSVTSPSVYQSSAAKPVDIEISNQNLAYCLYTSGSTGMPKGCMLTHENAVQGMLAFQRQFEGTWTLESRFLQFASFHFDVSVLEQFWSWSVGIRVVSAPRDLILKDIGMTIRMLQITHIDLTPSLAALVTPSSAPSLCRGLFITGGDLLKQEVLDAWGDKEVIYNAYGPTEVTIGFTMRNRAPRNIRPSNIGTQFENVGTIVLYPGTNCPVPIGGIGELCATGKLVGKGYLNRTETSMKVFTWSKQLSSRMYRTGDLVRMLSDFSFEFIGRRDTQIKLRGQRLEIGEINSVIKSPNEGIKDVITLILKHPTNQRDQLISFIVLESVQYEGLLPASETVNKLINLSISRCKAKLPGYMVPTYILPLSQVPLSVNNKVDLKGLAVLYSEATFEQLQSYSDHILSEPWTELELELRDVICEARKDLELSTLSRNTTFFELGYDSISLVSLTKRLRKRHAGIKMSTLLQYPSITLLASQLLREDFALKSKTITAQANLLNYHDLAYQKLDLSSEDIEYILPCTPLQEGIVTRAITSDEILYFNQHRFVLYEEVDITRLQYCWNTVVGSNQSLRACFLLTDSGVVQVILRQWNPYWLDTFEDEKQVLLKHWTSVKLSRPPLLFQVLEDRTLVMSIFHAIYDAYSLRITLEDVVKLYFYVGVPERPPFLDAIYRMQASYNEELAKLFWQEMYEKVLPLPQINYITSHGVALIKRRSIIPRQKVSENVKLLNCTPNVLFQAAFAICLAKWLGPKISFGLVVSGRIFQDDTDLATGPMFNTLPLAIDIESNGKSTTYLNIVAALQDISGRLVDFSHVPLRKIRKWIEIENLVNAIFVFQSAPDYDSEYQSALWFVDENGEEEYTTEYPLSLEVEYQEEIKFRIGYSKSFMTEDQASDFMSSLEHVISILISKPDTVVQLSSSPPRIEHKIGEYQHFGSSPESLQAITEVIALAAGVTSIDPYRSIFHYGLDSIDSIRLSTAFLRKGIDIPLSIIMRSGNAIEMARWVAAQSNQKVQHVNDARVNGMNQEVYYCTPLQEGILLESIASGNKLYVNQGIEIEELRKAFETVIQTNKIYRCSFVELEKNSVSHFGLAVHNSKIAWTTISTDDYEEALDSVFSGGDAILDYFKGPPIYFTLIETSKRQSLIITISHVLYDGHSIGLFFQDVENAYHGQVYLRPQFELMLGRILEDGSKIEHLNFWRSQLEGYRIIGFPNIGGEVHQLHQLTRKSITSRLDFTIVSEFAKREGVTLQTIGQTCFGILLSYYLGSDDVVFGTVLTGRVSEGDEQIQFPAMTTVPTRICDALNSWPTTLKNAFDSLFIYQPERGLVETEKRESLWIWGEGRTAGVEYNLAAELENVKNRHFLWTVATRKDRVCEESTEIIIQQLDWIFEKLVTGSSSREPEMLAVGQTSEVAVAVDAGRKAVGVYSTEKPENESTVSCCGTGRRRGILPIGCVGLLFASDSQQDEKTALFGGRFGRFLTKKTVELLGEYTLVASDVGRYNSSTHRAREDEQDASSSVGTEAVVAEAKQAWTGTEMVIRAVISAASGVDEQHVSKSDSIYRLGLDSISCIFVSKRLREQGIFLSVGEIIRLENVQAMAGHVLVARSQAGMETALDSVRRADGVVDSEDDWEEEQVGRFAMSSVSEQQIPPESSKAQVEQALLMLPATAGQIYMISCWINSGCRTFVSRFRYENGSTGEKEFDGQRMARAWRALRRMHPILRTAFEEAAGSRDNGNACQPVVQMILPVDDSHNDDGDDEIYDYDETFSIGDGPVDVVGSVPVHLRCNAEVVELVIHHALYDAWSLRMLERDLSELYYEQEAAFRRIGEMGVHVRDEFLGRVTDKAILERGIRRWNEKLKEVYVVQPDVVERDLDDGGMGDLQRRMVVEACERKVVEARAIEAGVSVAAVVLAAIAEALKSGQEEQKVGFGLYNSGRTADVDGIEELVFPTVNVHPFVVTAGGRGRDFTERVRAVQAELDEVREERLNVVGVWQVGGSGVEWQVAVNILLDDGVLDTGPIRARLHRMDERDDEQEGDSGCQETRMGALANLRGSKKVKASLDIEIGFRNQKLVIGVFSDHPHRGFRALVSSFLSFCRT
ncbi:uncharacterized protein V1516DRAFT_25942 [Lipomyces oligophaga]|uniref:uncharacterized protein n=1 Tax=Lipomyces oligophaga TaxID=45792 RepID=UPI0034CD7D2D